MIQPPLPAITQSPAGAPAPVWPGPPLTAPIAPSNAEAGINPAGYDRAMPTPQALANMPPSGFPSAPASAPAPGVTVKPYPEPGPFTIDAAPVIPIDANRPLASLIPPMIPHPVGGLPPLPDDCPAPNANTNTPVGDLERPAATAATDPPAKTDLEIVTTGLETVVKPPAKSASTSTSASTPTVKQNGLMVAFELPQFEHAPSPPTGVITAGDWQTRWSDTLGQLQRLLQETPQHPQDDQRSLRTLQSRLITWMAQTPGTPRGKNTASLDASSKMPAPAPLPLLEGPNPLKPAADGGGAASFKTRLGPGNIAEPNAVDVEANADPALDPRALAQAIEELAPLEIVDLRFCRQVAGFGQFDPLETETVRPGEELLVYCELHGVRAHWEPQENMHRSRLESTFEIYPQNSQQLVWRYTVGQAEDQCRRNRRDYFAAYALQLPQDLAPGAYRLRLIQLDLIAHIQTQREIPFQVDTAAPDSPAPAPSPSPVANDDSPAGRIPMPARVNRGE